MRTLEAFIRDKPSGCLYHYTGTAGLIGIIQNRKLWATDYKHLNDRNEYRTAAKLLSQVGARELKSHDREKFERLIAMTQKACYVLSFSEMGNQLSQWRAYCPGGNGYSLGFEQNNALFLSAEQHRFNLIRCVYDPKKQRELCQSLVESFIEGRVHRTSCLPGENTPSPLRVFFKDYQWKLALALVMSALKHRGFEEEKEWRLVSQYPDEVNYGLSFRPGRFGVTPYFELPLSTTDHRRWIDEITIGPTSNRVASRAALSLLLLKNETQVRRFQLSRIPFRHQGFLG